MGSNVRAGSSPAWGTKNQSEKQSESEVLNSDFFSFSFLLLHHFFILYKFFMSEIDNLPVILNDLLPTKSFYEDNLEILIICNYFVITNNQYGTIRDKHWKF